MDFKFPLPPIETPSPRLHDGSNDMSPVSSDLSTPRDGQTSSSASNNSPIASNPACVHPVFINSDLNPEESRFFDFEEEYPVDRLNPACMGYLNHLEYEAAMASINAIEAMYQNLSPPSDVDTMSEASERTLQNRRSASMSLS